MLHIYCSLALLWRYIENCFQSVSYCVYYKYFPSWPLLFRLSNSINLSRIALQHNIQVQLQLYYIQLYYKIFSSLWKVLVFIIPKFVTVSLLNSVEKVDDVVVFCSLTWGKKIKLRFTAFLLLNWEGGGEWHWLIRKKRILNA